MQKRMRLYSRILFCIVLGIASEIKFCPVNGIWEGEAPAEPSTIQECPFIAAQQELRPPDFISLPKRFTGESLVSAFVEWIPTGDEGIGGEYEDFHPAVELAVVVVLVGSHWLMGTVSRDSHAGIT